MESFSKIIEIKDWKKAKYEMNLAEVEKLREAKEQRKESRKKKISPEETTEGEVKIGEAVGKKEEKVIDITDANKNEENNQAEIQVDANKGKKGKPKKGKKEETE